MANILVIDDDRQVCETLQSLAVRQGHACFSAQTLGSGLDLLDQGEIDVVFLDVRLPDGNGLEALGRIRNREMPPDVIVLTGQGDPEGAAVAIQSGVWDYLVKPSPVKQIKETLRRALAHRVEKKAREEHGALDLRGLIGSSSIMRQSYDRIAQASASESTVLVTGETGTGKELLARVIHRNSPRASRSFVVVDCASLTESLLESILFGHTKGSFTGAARDRIGLVKLADRGTLFLDEIGELPLSAQKIFLRVLQERRFRPVGSSQEEESDFRLISATNRDLERMVKAGDFRQDLYYRINTIQLTLPPLRDREEDIVILAQYHIDRLCQQRNLPSKEMHTDFIDSIKKYEWPGNVRELFNTIEQSFVLSGGEDVLYSQHLPHSVRICVTKSLLRKGMEEERSTHLHSALCDSEVDFLSLKDFKIAMEREYLAKLLRIYGRDIPKMLSVSGLSRSHLYAMLKKHGLERPD